MCVILFCKCHVQQCLKWSAKVGAVISMPLFPIPSSAINSSTYIPYICSFCSSWDSSLVSPKSAGGAAVGSSSQAREYVESGEEKQSNPMVQWKESGLLLLPPMLSLSTAALIGCSSPPPGKTANQRFPSLLRMRTSQQSGLLPLATQFTSNTAWASLLRVYLTTLDSQHGLRFLF